MANQCTIKYTAGISCKGTFHSSCYMRDNYLPLCRNHTELYQEFLACVWLPISQGQSRAIKDMFSFNEEVAFRTFVAARNV